ncbi:hypothetical protein C8R44DRAFT_877139 [Mycena epipterygia]|nr:hypothetical protein C8R44DRAFT_877139 [Mycena epipterygia]
MNSDMEAAQVLGAARSILKSSDSDFSGISKDTPGEEVAPECIKLCAKRGVLELKPHVSEEGHRRLMDFPYLDSAQKFQEFDDFLPNSVRSRLVGPQSDERMDLAMPHKSLEAIENACKLDMRVAREIKISTSPQSTTIRKSRDSHKLADERIELDLEIEAIRAEKQESAARLKTLQARKSELRKRPRLRKPMAGTWYLFQLTPAVVSRLGKSVLARSLKMPVQPIASKSTAPVECASSANSDVATFVGSNQGRAYIVPAHAASAYPNAADFVVPTGAPAIYPPNPALTDFGGYIAPPDASNFGDGMSFNPNFDFNNFGNFNFNFEWSLLPDNFSLPSADTPTAIPSLDWDATIFMFDASTSKFLPQSATAPPSPRLPPIPISSFPPPTSSAVAPAPKPVSRKRKSNIDGLDLTNVIETTRTRRVRQRVD